MLKITTIIKDYKNFSKKEILLLIFPILIISGPFLSDLTVVYFSIIYAYLLIKNKDFENILFDYKYFFLFGIICFVSTFINSKIDILTLKSILLFRFYFFICFSIIIIESNKKLLSHFFILLFITLSVLTIDAYFQLLTNYNFFGFEKLDPKRLSGMFDDEYVLGSFLFKASILLLYTSCFSKINSNYSLILFLFIIEPMIFFSGQRGPFIISIIFVFGIFLVNYKSMITYISLIYLILLIGGNLLLNDKYNERFIYDVSANIKKENIIKIDNKNNKNISFSIFSPAHTQLYASSISMFSEKKLLGHGVNSFRKECVKYNACSTHPHNFYLQVLAETGLIGFIVIFCFFINITIDLLIKLKKIIINKNYEIKQSYYLNLGVFLIFFPLQPNGNLFNNYMLVNLSIIIVFYLYDKKLNE